MELIQSEKLHHFSIHVLDSETQEKSKIENLINNLGLSCQFAIQASELLAEPPNVQWGCVLLGSRVPFYQATELQELIKHMINLPIIFMGTDKDIEIAIQVLKAGHPIFY